MIADCAVLMIAEREYSLAQLTAREYGRRYTRKEVVRNFEYFLDM
jgi:hypothetical protein